MAGSWRMFVDYLINTITDGSLLNRDKMSSIGITPSFDRVMTKEYVRKMWAISMLPHECEFNIPELIRAEMTSKYPQCKTIVNIHSRPKRVAVETGLFKRLMGAAAKEYQNQEDLFQMLDDTDQITGKSLRIGSNARKITITKKNLDKAKFKKLSFDHVYRHQSSGGSFLRTVIIVEGLFPDEVTMNKYKETLIGILGMLNVGYREVRNDVTSFLTSYGVAGYVGGDIQQKTMLVSDTSLSYQTPYRVRGLVGGTGICLGIDRMTYLPFLINFFGSSAAQICLIYGRSGSGKSYMSFSTCLALIFEDVHCSVIDIKGDEWNRLMSLVPGAVEIKMGGSGARFVNTLRLDDLEVDEDNAESLFNMAVEGSKQLLSLMVSPEPGEGISKTDLEDVLEKAILKTYNNHGVFKERPSTFAKTKDLKLGHILDTMIDLVKSNTYEKTGKDSLAYKVVDRCSRFLSTEGQYADSFRNEITISDVIKAPLVIYSFGKNDGSMLDSLDSIRVFMVQYLDTKKQAMRKRKGQHSAAFYEELQRCKHFGKLVTFISHSVTGSRSNNVILFLLTNDLSAFDTGDMQPVRSNITTKIMGKTTEEDLEILTSRYGCEDVRANLNRVSKDPNYENCFVIKYDTGQTISKGVSKTDAQDSTIIKAILPSDLEEKFRTKDLKAM